MYITDDILKIFDIYHIDAGLQQKRMSITVNLWRQTKHQNFN